MKILLLGGTGAMGSSLVKMLENTPNQVFVTSRSELKSYNNIHYIKGNAHDLVFLKKILSVRYDAIVDFMVYSTGEFSERSSLFLESTNQYVFLSSSRVYAEANGLLTESSERLIDVCRDENYLKTDEYALSKGMQENILKKTEKKNWTVIRPYITYNTNRLQLGVYEKENWLWRCLKGKSIVIPKDILNKKTCVTYGGDVAFCIFKLIGNKDALGETFHITSDFSCTWKQVLDLYVEAIEKRTNKKVKIKIIDDSSTLFPVWNSAQIKYDRLYNREFDNTKIVKITGYSSFKGLEQLRECLNEFLDNPRWQTINWRFEAWCDSKVHSVKGVFETHGFKMKIRYLKWRFFDFRSY